MCIDLHSELSRQDQKGTSSNENAMEKHVSAEGSAAMQNGEASPAAMSQHAHIVNTLDSSTLIKANPSPQGTPLHTTFSGTQNFTPSTRISALNMVGDLLRKVGVSWFILAICCTQIVIVKKALESRLASCRTHTSGKELSQRHSRIASPGMDAPKYVGIS